MVQPTASGLGRSGAKSCVETDETDASPRLSSLLFLPQSQTYSQLSAGHPQPCFDMHENGFSHLPP